MKRLDCKVLIVGGGPGGYVAAIRSGQLGLDTILVEESRLGGTCLIRGCIPSKAIIHAAGLFQEMTERVGKGRLGISLSAPPQLEYAETVRWKDGVVDKLNGGVAALLKRAKVRVVDGRAVFSDAKTCNVATNEGPIAITAENVVLATGSLPIELPFLPFGGAVISSTEALALKEVPEQLAVIGAGYIGLELGIAFRKLGARVTVVEAEKQILPLYDAELTAPVRKWMEKHEIALHLGARAKGVKGDALVVEAEGKTLSLSADRILVTVGRRPNTEGWGLENMGVDMAGRFVRIDDRCATSMRGVYAIGDLTGEPMLAHRASAQGEIVAEIIAGEDRRFDPAAIAAICFTEPEIVSVGLSPAEARAQGHEVVAATFPFSASGRALGMDAGEGFVRIVARKDDHLVLGVQAVGAHASELSGEFAHAMEMRAVLEDIAGTIHVHPTLSEAFHESALRALGHAIHV
jgi:dihydrolipoamide dehydrogenase